MSTAKKISPQVPSADPTSESIAPSADVKKVSPYPFAVDVLKVEGQPPLKGMIVKLTDVGFLMRVDTLNFYKVSEKYQIHFLLPVMDQNIRSLGKVVKTYDGIEQLKKESSKKQYLVEIHFIELPSSSKTSINSYLLKSGQKKF